MKEMSYDNASHRGDNIQNIELVVRNPELLRGYASQESEDDYSFSATPQIQPSINEIEEQP